MRGSNLICGVLMSAVWGLQGCASQSDAKDPLPVAPKTEYRLPIPVAWGGEVRCANSSCAMAAVEHEVGRLVVYKLQKDEGQLQAATKLPYHPDAAKWLSDDLVAVAVEGSSAVHIYRLNGDALTQLAQISVGFAPRDVTVVQVTDGKYQLLATPYSGGQVTWINWSEQSPQAAEVMSQPVCLAPWHPQVMRKEGLGVAQTTIWVGCLDDRQLMVLTPPANGQTVPAKSVARFDAVPRNVAISPSTDWVYVALETGARNARVQSQTLVRQSVVAPAYGNVSVVVVDEQTVAWGEDGRVVFQKLDAAGQVLEARALKVSGFPTSLQLVDADLDGQQDLVVYNSAGDFVDVLLGPLWERAAAVTP